MSDRPYNPPAFPRTGEGFGNPNYDESGMFLRDYFAAKAIDKMISLSQEKDGSWSVVNVAIGCYELADAMLRVRGQS